MNANNTTVINGTAEALHWAAKQELDEKPRQYLGMSGFSECARQGWYNLRWAVLPEFDGRMASLFDRGHREEPVILARLKKAGLEVYGADLEGEQFALSEFNGWLRGHFDGIARNVPELVGTKNYNDWVLLEMKTHNKRSFTDLQNKGVTVSKPQHFNQMQAYMHYSGNDKDRLKFALYIAVCKDDDHLHVELISYDKEIGAALARRAEETIFDDEPPPRPYKNASNMTCRFCDFSEICHSTKLPLPNCRTCAHVDFNRDGKLNCTLKGHEITDQWVAMDGCDDHIYNPHMLNHEWVQSSSAENWAEFRTHEGRTFKNGSRSQDTFQSKELHKLDPKMLGDPNLIALREKFDVEVIEHEDFDDEIPF